MAKRIVILNGSPRKKETPHHSQKNSPKEQLKPVTKLMSSCYQQ